LYFVVTIDTEEDNWGDYSGPSYSLENIKKIPGIQEVFHRYEVKPTYLISYPVATDPVSIGILGKYRDQGLCEIGSHPHPWNTPPMEEERSPFNSFINNLPSVLQYNKIKMLHDTIVKNFSVTPTSYRSGRWGFCQEVARNLIRLGYRIDTSITPYWDWTIYGGPDFSEFTNQLYKYSMRDLQGTPPRGSLLEVPATVGFIQDNFELAYSFYRRLQRFGKVGEKSIALMNKIGMLNRVCLSPETHDAPQMILLSRKMMFRGAKVLNMYFHSPSLLENCSPFVKTSSDAKYFLARIEKVIVFAKSAGMKSVTLSQLLEEKLDIQKEIIMSD